MSGIAAARWTGELRPYQHGALDRLGARWERGDRRAWIVLPPGSGKTLVGLEAARRLGRRTVVFTPNTAIQHQWAAHWDSFARPDGCTAGRSRTLADDVTVLTYQSMAVFDPDAETDEDGDPTPLLERLHANGAALVASLHDAGPLTIILDECHHLLQMWGRLLSEVLAEMDDAYVIGLTGTPATQLSSNEADLVAELFGDPIHGASIPALVRDGYLAPFAELAWLAAPTSVEHEYINGQALRFTELCTDLLEPGFADPDFPTWLRLRFHDRADADGGRLTWSWLAEQEPDLTDAALRLHHAGLAALPPDAKVLERHRHPPKAADWMTLLSDYVTGHLLPAEDGSGNAAAVDRIRAALPAVGYQLTKRGVRAGRSPVDRVLARSAAKARGAVEITAAESVSLGRRLRALILCDHERARARPSARLREVLADDAGSAREVIGLMAADERIRALAPLLVTGANVVCSEATAAAFIAWAGDRATALGLATEPCDDTGLVRITGQWSSRTWVPMVTAFLEGGHCKALIGTRALLGEGWDARSVNTVVDLTNATTATAVVQGRGRALRLDPDWTGKTAHTWTVVCVSAEHPKGEADWNRFVRKHDGYLAVDAEGAVVSGVAHVDPDFSVYEPPAAAELDAVNARMLVRAEDRDATRATWRIGSPYTDELLPTLRVIPTRGSGDNAPAEQGRPEAPDAVPAAAGITAVRAPRRRPTPLSVVAGAGAGAVAAVAAIALGLPYVPLPADPAETAAVLVPLSALAAERTAVWRRRVRAAIRLVGIASGPPDTAHFGYAVADALHAIGRSDIGAEGVRVRVGADGAGLVTLTGGGPAAAEEFRVALDEVLGPVTGAPRYLIARYENPVLSDTAARRAARNWLLRRTRAEPVGYHEVPAVFARSKAKTAAFTRSWSLWISGAEPVDTRTAQGRSTLYTWSGTRPYPATTVSRLTWT